MYFSLWSTDTGSKRRKKKERKEKGVDRWEDPWQGLKTRNSHKFLITQIPGQISGFESNPCKKNSTCIKQGGKDSKCLADCSILAQGLAGKKVWQLETPMEIRMQDTFLTPVWMLPATGSSPEIKCMAGLKGCVSRWSEHLFCEESHFLLVIFCHIMKQNFGKA